MALDLVQKGTLNPNGIMRAVGGLVALKEGLKAVAEGVYPGKVVIYPHLVNLSLTALEDLSEAYPDALAAMEHGSWTNAAEKALFNSILE